MTTANKVTIARILLIPFFVVEVLYYVRTGNELYRMVGIGTFLLASICDGVDGYIARRYNQKSELGAILDPLADKLLLVSGVVLLSFDHEPYLDSVPLWLTATIIGRDLLLLIGLGVIFVTVGKVAVQPRIIGKVATVLQMVVVLWVLFKWGKAWLFGLTLSAAVCTGVSGFFTYGTACVSSALIRQVLPNPEGNLTLAAECINVGNCRNHHKQEPKEMSMAIQVGAKAPDFNLKSKQAAGLVDVKLSENFGKKNTVLLFFPAAFTGVCTQEMCDVTAGLQSYSSLNADVIGISVDTPFAQEAWAQKEKISITLVSDLNKETTKAYGVLFPMLAGIGDTAARAAFVVDKNGVVQYSERTATPKDLPSFDKVKETLARLK